MTKTPDKNLTDSDIVKALKWCEQFTDNLVWANVDTKKRTLGLQAMQTCKSALDLINRLQAENERLNFVRTRDAQRYEEKISNQAHTNCVLIDLHSATIKEVKELEEKLKTAKAEAYKEFAERLNEEAEKVEIDQEGDFVEADFKIYDTVANWCKATSDNLLKELVGE